MLSLIIRKKRIVIPLCLGIFGAACDATNSTPGDAGIRVVAGDAFSDTIDTRPVQALVVEVRGDNGDVIPGTVVRFDAVRDPAAGSAYVGLCRLAVACTFPTSVVTDTTDSRGRAKANVALIGPPGDATVRVLAPDSGYSTKATYTIKTGKPARVVRSLLDTTLDIGATVTLASKVVDRNSNALTDAVTYSVGTGSAVTVAAATGVVTAREFGTQWVYSRSGNFLDSTRFRVLPPGRLAVVAGSEVRLVNLNGSNNRLVVDGVSSDRGVYPRFNATRDRLTLQNGTSFGLGGIPTVVTVADTAGTPIRKITPNTTGFSAILATRQIADGTIMVVGERLSNGIYGVWRIANDNSLTFLGALPDLGYTYNSADISIDGTRVAYLGTVGQLNELRVLTIATGVITTIAPSARSPRWSPTGDRILYMVPINAVLADLTGSPVVINANGTGRRTLSTLRYDLHVSWSSDGQYIIGRLFNDSQFRIQRISDGAEVVFSIRNAAGDVQGYTQAEWR